LPWPERMMTNKSSPPTTTARHFQSLKVTCIARCTLPQRKTPERRPGRQVNRVRRGVRTPLWGGDAIEHGELSQPAPRRRSMQLLVFSARAG
jgi:hypothetical protein